MATSCRVGGCSNPVPEYLREQNLCLDHFLTDVQDRIRSYARQLDDQGPNQELHKAAMQYILLTAAKLATIGMQNPPADQLGRGQILNAMLLLADLRERFEKTLRKKAAN